MSQIGIARIIGKTKTSEIKLAHGGHGARGKVARPINGFQLLKTLKRGQRGRINRRIPKRQIPQLPDFSDFLQIVRRKSLRPRLDVPKPIGLTQIRNSLAWQLEREL